MGEKSPLKTIIKTSLPAVVDLSSQTIMFTIEAIFIGKIGHAALAGQGMAIQLIIAFFMILITFILGSSLIIVRHLGAEQFREANHVLGQALMIGIIISFIFSSPFCSFFFFIVIILYYYFFFYFIYIRRR